MVTSACCTSRTARPICHCLGVTEAEIRQTIVEGELASVRQVAHACGAGSGCTACHRHIRRYLHEAAQRRTAEERAEQPAFGFA
jgi:bacterioferritin-associated ferredoxin